jgi:hypothetical protein
MSRNEKRIRDVLAEFGFKVKSIVWEPVRRGSEMCGPDGGWLINDDWPVGYSTDHAIQTIREQLGRKRQRAGGHT